MGCCVQDLTPFLTLECFGQTVLFPYLIPGWILGCEKHLVFPYFLNVSFVSRISQLAVAVFPLSIEAP